MAFEGEAWAAADPVVVPLTRVFRQAQAAFAAMLAEVRRGQCSPATLAALQARVGVRPPPDAAVTCLRARNRDVDALNASAFAALPGDPRVFLAQDEGPDAAEVAALRKHCPAPDRLELKVGAAVILLRNLHVESGLVNGAQGHVVGFDSWPLVRFARGGAVLPVTPQSWTVEHGWDVVGDGEVVRWGWLCFCSPSPPPSPRPRRTCAPSGPRCHCGSRMA
jgi:ATP-dependent DNA helicase PIF1